MILELVYRQARQEAHVRVVALKHPGGRREELARLSAAELERRASNNGDLELLNWLLMAATVPAERGEPVYYEPMPAWYTGMAASPSTCRPCAPRAHLSDGRSR